MSKTYIEKLRDPRWQRLRLLILERDKWTCQWCNSTDRTLHVHHRRYFREQEPWESNPEHLVTLCEACHAEESACRKEAERTLLQALHIGDFLAEDVQLLACAIAQLMNEADAGDYIAAFDAAVRTESARNHFVKVFSSWHQKKRA